MSAVSGAGGIIVAAKPFFISAVSGAGGIIIAAAKVLVVPYAAVLMLLYSAQRAIIYQSPNVVADPTQTGGKLVVLPAAEPLLPHTAAPTATHEGAGGEGVMDRIIIAKTWRRSNVVTCRRRME